MRRATLRAGLAFAFQLEASDVRLPEPIQNVSEVNMCGGNAECVALSAGLAGMIQDAGLRLGLGRVPRIRAPALDQYAIATPYSSLAG